MNSNNAQQSPSLNRPSEKTESNGEIFEKYSIRFLLSGKSYPLLVQGLKDTHGNVRFDFIFDDNHPQTTFDQFVTQLNTLRMNTVTLAIKKQKLTKLNITFKVVDGKLVFHRAEEPTINTLVSYYKASRFRSKDEES